MTVDQSSFKLSDVVKVLIPEEKLASIIQTFAELDSNHDGKIELDEYFDYALNQEKIRLTKKFQSVDADNDGGIDFEEFVVATEPNFQILRKFHELDHDQNGRLSLEEVINIADVLALPLNRQQLRAIIQEVDQDQDGEISYYEYLGAIAHVGFQ